MFVFNLTDLSDIYCSKYDTSGGGGGRRRGRDRGSGGSCYLIAVY